MCIRDSADCVGGRDFRDQNDAKKGQKTRLPEAEGEGLNASLVGGKSCRGQTTADDAAYSKKVCKTQRAMQTE